MFAAGGAGLPETANKVEPVEAARFAAGTFWKDLMLERPVWASRYGASERFWGPRYASWARSGGQESFPKLESLGYLQKGTERWQSSCRPRPPQ